jgi:hypothetical protein
MLGMKSCDVKDDNVYIQYQRVLDEIEHGTWMKCVHDFGLAVR